MQLCLPELASFDTKEREHSIKPLKYLTSQVKANASDAPQRNSATLNNNQECVTLVEVQSGQFEVVFPYQQFRIVPVPPSVRGIRFDGDYSNYCADFPPMFYTELSQVPICVPNSISHQDVTLPMDSSQHSDPEIHNSEQVYHTQDQNDNCAMKEVLTKPL
uniref:Uncharacterized protein n=1 Tax=Nelumbo nucifera TaxID=4432 RepID=A0A822X9C7_NELNU|nr:TPA_asm: hypothetical protein HUJ06_019527 [Nelumbo nucifera]